MTIEKKTDGKKLELKVSGRLDTMTAPELESVIKESIDGAEALVLDFEDLEYISSAGLRVVLGARKAMGDSAFCVRNLCSDVREIFDITGFSGMLHQVEVQSGLLEDEAREILQSFFRQRRQDKNA